MLRRGPHLYLLVVVSSILTAACGDDDPIGQPDPLCGNNVVETGEACDDSYETSSCDADCSVAECGDGTTNAAAGEACDDAGESATCTAECTASVCADGIFNATASEGCDDGGISTADGCDDRCAVEPGWDCVGSPSVCIQVGALPPPDTVAVNFSIDDSGNQTYASADGLAWKGGFSYDDTTRILTPDPAWSGPFVLLWDDGPWDAGGHEPLGSGADDSVWGITVFVPTPSSEVFIEYGAIRGSIAGSDGQWIWQSSNGVVTLPANDTTPVTAAGMTIPTFGDVDLRLTLDSQNLDGSYTFDPMTGTIGIKSSAIGWLGIPLADDGNAGDETASDGIYTFVMSQHVGAGTNLPHTGLLHSADTPEFLFEIDSVEYRTAGNGSTIGVGAATMQPPASSWSPVTVEVSGSNGSTFVTVP